MAVVVEYRMTFVLYTSREQFWKQSTVPQGVFTAVELPYLLDQFGCYVEGLFGGYA